MSNAHVHLTLAAAFQWFAPKEAAPMPSEEELLAGDLERLHRAQQRERERIAETTQMEMDAMRRQGWL